MLAHAFAWSKTIKNIQKWVKKVLFSSCTQEAHVRLTKKNEEKSLLVSDWEWLPKAGWHPNAGCSFGILLFFVLFSTWASHVHDAKCFLKNYSFSSVFDHFRPCELMRKHAFAGRNTQQVASKNGPRKPDSTFSRRYKEVEKSFSKLKNFVAAQFRFTIDSIDKSDGHFRQWVAQLTSTNWN